MSHLLRSQKCLMDALGGEKRRMYESLLLYQINLECQVFWGGGDLSGSITKQFFFFFFKAGKQFAGAPSAECSAETKATWLFWQMSQQQQKGPKGMGPSGGWEAALSLRARAPGWWAPSLGQPATSWPFQSTSVVNLSLSSRHRRCVHWASVMRACLREGVKNIGENERVTSLLPHCITSPSPVSHRTRNEGARWSKNTECELLCAWIKIDS